MSQAIHPQQGNERYVVGALVAPGDALCKPLLPQLYEAMLTNIGNGILALRGFEKIEAPEGHSVVQKWRGELLMTSASLRDDTTRDPDLTPGRPVRDLVLVGIDCSLLSCDVAGEHYNAAANQFGFPIRRTPS